LVIKKLKFLKISSEKGLRNALFFEKSTKKFFIGDRWVKQCGNKKRNIVSDWVPLMRCREHLVFLGLSRRARSCWTFAVGEKQAKEILPASRGAVAKPFGAIYN